MKYISQLNGFWNWVRTNEISHLEVDLYLSILDIANTSSWKTQFTIPNSTLGRFDKNTLTRARNKLVQYGLIKYNKVKKGQAPTYSITKLYNTEISPNYDTYIDTNSDTNSDTNVIPIQGTYIEKEKEKDKTRNNPPIPPYREIVDMFNGICTSFPKVTAISENRKKAIGARLKKYSLDDFEKLFRKAEASSFLKGANSRNWCANFDWILKDANMAKVLDGNYDSKTDAAQSGTYSDLEELSRKRAMTRGGEDA